MPGAPAMDFVFTVCDSQAALVLRRRIGLFLDLPLEKLDHLARQSRAAEIERS